MGLVYVEYKLEDISKQNGWGNSPPNPTGRKLMHINFYRNYIFLKSDIPFKRCVMPFSLPEPKAPGELIV